MNKSISNLFSRGNKFLGTKYPIMCGAMTWVSERNLVSAISNSGGFGIIACGSMKVAQLEKEILETKKLTKNFFGVNLILLHPEIDDLIECCVANNVNLVVFAGGFPKKRQIEILKINLLKQCVLQLLCQLPKK